MRYRHITNVWVNPDTHQRYTWVSGSRVCGIVVPAKFSTYAVERQDILLDKDIPRTGIIQRDVDSLVQRATGLRVSSFVAFPLEYSEDLRLLYAGSFTSQVNDYIGAVYMPRDYLYERARQQGISKRKITKMLLQEVAQDLIREELQQVNAWVWKKFYRYTISIVDNEDNKEIYTDSVGGFLSEGECFRVAKQRVIDFYISKLMC